MAPVPLRPLLGALVLAAAPGCVLIDVRSGGPVPRAAALAALEPGVTTRAEVLGRLGPSEEYRGPVPGSRSRAYDPQTVRVVDERDVFDRELLTWVAEERRERVFVLPLLFTWRRTVHAIDRVLVTLDEHDRVALVASHREIGLPEHAP